MQMFFLSGAISRELLFVERDPGAYFIGTCTERDVLNQTTHVLVSSVAVFCNWYPTAA